MDAYKSPSSVRTLDPTLKRPTTDDARHNTAFHHVGCNISRGGRLGCYGPARRLISRTEWDSLSLKDYFSLLSWQWHLERQVTRNAPSRGGCRQGRQVVVDDGQGRHEGLDKQERVTASCHKHACMMAASVDVMVNSKTEKRQC
jgi:hypothetical protein